MRSLEVGFCGLNCHVSSIIQGFIHGKFGPLAIWESIHTRWKRRRMSHNQTIQDEKSFSWQTFFHATLIQQIRFIRAWNSLGRKWYYRSSLRRQRWPHLVLRVGPSPTLPQPTQGAIWHSLLIIFAFFFRKVQGSYERAKSCVSVSIWALSCSPWPRLTALKGRTRRWNIKPTYQAILPFLKQFLKKAK